MFDLSKIKFIKKDEDRSKRAYSFVGIRKNLINGDVEFWLPLGFEDFNTDSENENTFKEVKTFFFRMYKTFKKYLADKKLEQELLDNQRDGLYDKESGGFRFTNENFDDLLLYSKLNAFDKIIQGYDELRIASLENKAVRTPVIDYAQLHKYLHKAIYLDEDVIYVDEMNLPKSVIVKDSTPLIELFCFIYSELKKELEDFSDLTPHVLELADNFREEHLTEVSGLFEKDTFADTISILKERLDEIDLYTTYKDEDYWHFYEAVESFLYAENDFNNTDEIYWGIRDFSDIWEQMCQKYSLEHFENVLYADVDDYLEKRIELKGEPFEIRMHGTNPKNSEPKPRYLRPDLVLLNEYPYEAKKLMNLIFKKRPVRIPSIHNLTNFEAVFSEKSYIHFADIIDLYEEICRKYSRRYYETGESVYKNLTERNFSHFENKALKIIEQIEPLKLIRLEPFRIDVDIIDYKYMSKVDYEDYIEFHLDLNGENKTKDDIRKQLVYEYAIQNNYPNSTTKSEFWIPGWFDNDWRREVKIVNPQFTKSQIEVVEINFKMVQENYLKDL
jgi:hypothetical protein